MKTITAAIVAALTKNPGEHDAKALYVIVRGDVEGLGYGTFRTKLTDAVAEGKIKRSGTRGLYLFSV